MEKNKNIFSPANRQEWRQWLEENHSRETSVWLLFYKKSAKIATLTWAEAVEEALCFGWIDSLAKPFDEERYMQFFSRRKPKGVWSKINKANVQKLIDAGLMTKAGFDIIEVAKQNGSWTILDDVEELIIPADLAKALADKPNANAFFQKLSRSDKRNLLQWLVLAKRPETRQKRVNEIVTFTDQNLKPKILQWAKKPE
ncbi:YdeI/OmpD-associated family protein [Spirosoma arboris]|uniref:YdeI/OmpD-associated family protein n=1 Tax=Spirosoma arboris TaxID=2682092 RepID=UPI00293C05AA|nr:YdeI/OmpD-associated family protein [Spirosoma arboris]